MTEKTLKFQEMFIEKILSGEKVFTTRKPDITYKKGDILTCLNARTLKPFGKIEILNVSKVMLFEFSGHFSVEDTGSILDLKEFAEKEGFNSYSEKWLRSKNDI